jgi:ElaB/YqjD/DUF883 family membrane-anchored ribosome-binding protein
MNNQKRDTTSLELPSFIRAILRMYFHLRTVRIRKIEIDRIKSIEEALETTTNEYEKASVNGEIDKMKIFNISLFTLTIEYDISALKFMILFQMDKWNKQLLCRQLVVVLYESTEDLLELLGKDLRLLINKLPESDMLSKELKKQTKELNKFKSNNMKFLQEVRNYCGAHRDKEAYKQLLIINSINTDDLLVLLADFMQPVSRLTPFYSKVMNAMIKIS